MVVHGGAVAVAAAAARGLGAGRPPRCCKRRRRRPSLPSLQHCPAEGESEPIVLGDSGAGDKGFERATKKTFTFASRDLGQLQRVRGGRAHRTGAGCCPAARA